MVNHTTKTIHYHHHCHHHQDIGNWRILQSDWGKSISSYIFGTWILTSQNFQNFHYCCETYSDTFGSLLPISHFIPFLPCCSVPKEKEKISKNLKTDFFLLIFLYFFLFRPFEIQFHLPWSLLIEPDLINLKFNTFLCESPRVLTLRQITSLYNELMVLMNFIKTWKIKDTAQLRTHQD